MGMRFGACGGWCCAAAVLFATGVAAASNAFSPPEGANVAALADGAVRVAWWRSGGQAFFAIAPQRGEFASPTPADYRLLLRAGHFDPLTSSIATHPALVSAPGSTLQIVQFWTQPLPEFRADVQARGATIRHYLANNAFIVNADVTAQAALRELPYVRWVGPYHPEYRLEEAIRDALADGGAQSASLPAKARYNVQIAGRGLLDKLPVAELIETAGGAIDALIPEGFVIEATLTLAQLLEVVHSDHVIFIDRWLPPVTYLDNVRVVGGANAVESVAGYTGAGVRGEVMDSNLLTTHPAFVAIPPILHGGRSGDSSHGTSVYGIVFGNGTGNAAGRGLIPSGQGIFADFGFLTNRYQHTAELLGAPYFAVFQTNSWGSCCTTQYGTAAATADDILFDNDIMLLQAQANSGSTQSDAIAFAKNLVSVGGIRHQNTSNLADDVWQNAGSIGPATDGRIKPDLSFWYESILTTSSTGGYTTGFGGTSAATPTTAGHFGLFFEMWSDGIFGNPVNSSGTVFENRPHATTAKAMMINTARPYAFSGTAADLTRTHQGWGLPNVQRLYDRRDSFFIVNEERVLENLDVDEFRLIVPAGTPELRATLVYLDPPGVPSSTRHRVNDLSLKLIAPGGVPFYWGNNGLTAANASTIAGAANLIDTVENVWVLNPAAGEWTVQVHASEIVQDAHVETPEIDADYALVVSGVQPVTVLLGDMNCDGVVTVSDIPGFVLAITDPAAYADQFPTCNILNGDLTGDGSVSVNDIAGFVALVTGS